MALSDAFYRWRLDTEAYSAEPAARVVDAAVADYRDELGE